MARKFVLPDEIPDKLPVCRPFSSSEECYASPVEYPRSKHYIDGRARRTRGSSLDKDSMHGDLLNEDYRARGPTLAAIPAQYVRLENDHPIQVIETGSPVVSSVWNVLMDYKVDVRGNGMLLVGRRTIRWDQKDTAMVLPTLFVYATNMISGVLRG